MKSILVGLGIGFLVMATGFGKKMEGNGVQATGFLFREIEAAGGNLRYVIYLPRDYESRESWPMILFLHGLGESGTDGVRQLSQGLGVAIQRAPERWPFVVVFPQKPGKEQWETHEEAVMAIVRKTLEDYRIDEDRVYLTGLSQGGHGTMVFGSMYAELWAAIAPVCGYADPEPLVGALKEMPVWLFHGDADAVVPVEESERFAEALEAVGGEPKLTIYAGVNHNSWDRAYAEPELPGWFLSKRKTKKERD